MARKKLLPLCIMLCLGVAGTASAAMVGTIATFDVDEAGFQGSTTATTQIHQAAGGNPGGYVVIRKELSSGFDIGTRNSATAGFLGDYAAAGVTGAGFDIQPGASTAIDETHLRFRRSVGENGWYYNFGAVAANSPWTSFDVSFDPTWSDLTAAANGWTQESGAPSFALVLGDVQWIEARLINPMDTSLLACVDNVRLVPEPATLGLLGAGLVGLARRRRA